MKRLAIGMLLFLINTIELNSTAHRTQVSKVRQEYVQRLEYVMRPNNAPLFELFRFLNQNSRLGDRAVAELVPEVLPEITVILMSNYSVRPTRSRSVVADEDLGYDSDDDVQPLFDF